MRNTYISVTSSDQALTHAVSKAFKCAIVDHPQKFCNVALNNPIILAKLKDGIRRIDNFIEIDWIQYDFDEGITCAEIQNKLKDNFYIMLGSKNHQKEKTGKDGAIIPACDRFHVFLLLDKPITDPEYYKFYLEMFAKEQGFNCKMDGQAKDCTRYFDIHSCIIHINDCQPPSFSLRYSLPYNSHLAQRATEELQYEKIRKSIEQHVSCEDINLAVLHYVESANASISGFCGHNVAFATACQIIQLGGNFEHFKHYNETKCDPKWSAKELEHKWKDAKRKNRGKVASIKIIEYWRDHK